jgi:hypothetical protein
MSLFVMILFIQTYCIDPQRPNYITPTLCEIRQCSEEACPDPKLNAIANDSCRFGILAPAVRYGIIQRREPSGVCEYFTYGNLTIVRKHS